MAATGFTPIQLYRTTTASAQPSAGNLADGELAINLTDKKLYAKDASNNVFVLADASSGGTTATNLAGGAAGSVPYQTGANATTFLGIGTAAQVLQVNSGATAPEWVNTSGTGDVARTTSPSFTTPSLGAATALSINSLTLTTSTGTFTLANGKTLTVNNSLTLSGTDATTMTFPSTSATIARTDAAQTFTGTQTVQAAATQDAVALAGRAGGTSSYVSTLTPTTLSASRTVTLPDADTTVPVATQVLTFTGPTAGRTITLPDANFTVARSDAAQSFTGTQTFLSNPVLDAGTANGVLYLDGSKVVTSGSALTFDGTTLKVQNNNTVSPVFQIQSYASVGTAIANITYDQSTDIYKLSNPSTYAGSGIDFGAGASSATRYHIDTSGVHVWTVASEGMRLNSTGLGIGTNNPAYKLDVNGIVRSVVGSGHSFQSLRTSDFYYSNFTADGIDTYTNTNSSAPMLFKTGGSERMRLDSSGNLGLGVTPSASTSTVNLQVKGTAVLTGNSSGAEGAYLTSNAIFNSGWKYISTAAASRYDQGLGAHAWYTALSGTAGDAISFTQAMTLDASGRLLVGRTNNFSGEALQIDANGVGSTVYSALIGNSNTSTAAYNTMRFIQGASGSATGYLGTGGSAVGNASFANNFVVGTQTSHALVFNTNDTERARIDSSGNLGLGVTPSATWASASRAFQLKSYSALFESVSGKTILSFNAIETATNTFNYSQTEAATMYQQVSGVHSWYTALSGTAGDPISFSQAMTLDANGNLGIGTTSPASYNSGGNSLVVGGSGNFKGMTIASAVEGNIYFADGTNGTETYRGIVGYNHTSDFMSFYTAANERARITSGGKWVVNSVSDAFPGVELVRSTVVADEAISVWNDTTTGDGLFIKFYTDAGTGRGQIDYDRAGGLTRYSTTSDYRAKDIIGPVQNPGATIDSLKIYEGVMKGATRSRPMLVAHEAQEHAPYAVSGVKDEVNEDGTPKFQQMDVSSLVPLLLAEIQSLRARLAAAGI